MATGRGSWVRCDEGIKIARWSRERMIDFETEIPRVNSNGRRNMEAAMGAAEVSLTVAWSGKISRVWLTPEPVPRDSWC